MKRVILVLVLLSLLAASCKEKMTETAVKQAEDSTANWKQKFKEALPLLGHRNWIIIADKAFPQQNAAGIEYINTDEKLVPVLSQVLEEIKTSTHVKPVIYTDKELGFIKEEQAPGVKQFAADCQKLFDGQSVQTLLHDSVFTKLGGASKLFKVLVLKTNEVIPYTSVFLQLDCKYWDAEKEKDLRKSMK